ncbi:hypothetical protein ABII15_07405 [Streptomyces sp. HUAS MG91]|uniref:Uncharacterized protein n=1 Tax=Streptomyces tabacisoli TaxID=3156398 RepID=A0AAU8INL9_9ACTN
MTAARLSAFVAAALAAVLLLIQLPAASVHPASAATARFVALAADVTQADGHHYGLTDDTGATMDAAQIVQAPDEADGTYLAVYHTMRADGRFHSAVATSADLLHWQRRHDFGAGSSQPALAADGHGGYVLAYEKDPRNHIAVRAYDDLDALLTGRAAHRFDAPRTLSACAEGTPAITAVHGGTVELTGHYRADCDTDRQLTATLRNYTTWHAAPDHRLDRAVERYGTGGNIGDRDRLGLAGEPMVLIEGQRRRNDFGSWSAYAYDPASGRADRVPLRTGGGSTSFANPSATRITDPGGHRALLVSLFIPAEGAAPGEAGQLVYWREL